MRTSLFCLGRMIARLSILPLIFGIGIGMSFAQSTQQTDSKPQTLSERRDVKASPQSSSNAQQAAATALTQPQGEEKIRQPLNPKSALPIRVHPAISPVGGDPCANDPSDSSECWDCDSDDVGDCAGGGGPNTPEQPPESGGGASSPEITVIAWLDASAVSLPSGANSVLEASLQNGTSAQIALCVIQVSSWATGNKGLVLTSADAAYATAWLAKNSGNSPPPSQIVASTVQLGGNFRLFSDTMSGTAQVGSTPDPCNTGNITGWYPALSGETNSYTGTGTSPSGLSYLLTEGRIGDVGQIVNSTLNQTSTPWIWNAIEYDSTNTPSVVSHAMFPTYSVYTNGVLTNTYSQSSISVFAAQNDTYEITPSQLP